MFNRDKKEEQLRRDVRPSVNVTPSLGTSVPGRNPPENIPAETASPETLKPGPVAADTKGSKLIVGPDIKLKGVEITDCDTLVVEGRVEAAMDSRVIHIAEHGVFSGTVGIDIAEINGRFEGELTARKQLVIRSSGKVSGKIRYGKISVEEGGEISGDVGSLSMARPLTSGKSAEAQQGNSGSADIMTPYDPFAPRKPTTPSKHSGPPLAS